jgi:predicted cupin superfamily sugar epimerase
MSTRPTDLIAQLALQPHPEGGHYAETFRSTAQVHPDDGRSARSALTAIYFLLESGAFSAWHQVRSDESWHWYEGEPLELFMAPAAGGEIRTVRLGALAHGGVPQCVVPAGWWQAARPTGAYALVGCTVGPGFDFADFVLLSMVDARERPVLMPAPLAESLL